jgi:hypothetical protein
MDKKQVLIVVNFGQGSLNTVYGPYYNEDWAEMSLLNKGWVPMVDAATQRPSCTLFWKDGEGPVRMMAKIVSKPHSPKDFPR